MVKTREADKGNGLTMLYRQTELSKVDTPYVEYMPKIKIIKPNGETKWLDITEKELAKIKDILLSK